MRIAEVVAEERRPHLPPLQARVLRYLEEHSAEVFPYRDAAICEALGIKPGALGFTLWALHQGGHIGSEHVGRRVYFGSHGAIRALREGRGMPPAKGHRRRSRSVSPGDPFERARELRDRIYAREGNIDVIALLDEVRGPWA